MKLATASKKLAVQRKKDNKVRWVENLKRSSNEQQQESSLSGVNIRFFLHSVFITCFSESKKRRKPKQNPKTFQNLSRGEKCRRRRLVEKIVPGAGLASSLDAEQTLALKLQGNFSKEQMAIMKKATSAGV